MFVLSSKFNLFDKNWTSLIETLLLKTMELVKASNETENEFLKDKYVLPNKQ